MVNLLIVDDDKDLLNTFADYFITLGHRITKAENGLEAFEFFKHDNFDLAILDVELPELNGLDLTKKIKKINPNFPIILITGYSHLYRPQDVLSLDVEAFLKKPLNLFELTSIVSQIISRKKSGLKKK